MVLLLNEQRYSTSRLLSCCLNTVFFCNNSLLHGHDNKRILISEIIVFLSRKKSKEKMVQDFFAFSIFIAVAFAGFHCQFIKDH